jgi:hypothetical protein
MGYFFSPPPLKILHQDKQKIKTTDKKKKKISSFKEDARLLLMLLYALDECVLFAGQSQFILPQIDLTLLHFEPL